MVATTEKLPARPALRPKSSHRLRCLEPLAEAKQSARAYRDFQRSTMPPPPYPVPFWPPPPIPFWHHPHVHAAAPHRLRSPRKSAKKKQKPKPKQVGPNFLTPRQMEKRLGQINIGKQTRGYKNYRAVVPKSSRTSEHPKTPDQTEIISKRRFDGKLRVWRNALHEFDQVPPLTLLPACLDLDLEDEKDHPRPRSPDASDATKSGSEDVLISPANRGLYSEYSF